MREYGSFYYDQEVNIKSATIREDVTVGTVPLTANVIATVSNTQALIETINITAASNPALGIRYDTLVANSGQPDLSNITYSSLVANSGQPDVPMLVSQALGMYAVYSNADTSNTSVVVRALEATDISADDVLVGNVDAVLVESGNVVADVIHTTQLYSSNVIAQILSGQVIVLDPFMMCTLPEGLALCYRSSSAPVQSQTVVQGYKVIAMFNDDP